jgi:hypothetical protein
LAAILAFSARIAAFLSSAIDDSEGGGGGAGALKYFESKIKSSLKRENFNFKTYGYYTHFGFSFFDRFFGICQNLRNLKIKICYHFFSFLFLQ